MPPLMASVIRYEMSKIIIGKINALSVYIVWACLGLGGVMLPITGAFFKELFPVAITLFITGFAIMPIHLVLAFFVRCPHCGKCLTIQGMRPPHESFEKGGALNGWATVVVKWFSGSVGCIHCGKNVDTNNL